MNLTEQSMGLGLRAARLLAGSPVLDRLGIRDGAERVLYRATRDGFRAANTAGRTFSRVAGGGRPERLEPRRSDLFDLTPDDEQQMLVEAWTEFAARELRRAAADADEALAPPEALVAQAHELGLTMLGVPEALGGAVSERSTVTSVLAAQTLAHGDMGLAVAALAPAGVAAALALHGDAAQQATYLPAFVSDEVPVAALALLEPAPLFDPFTPGATARRVDGGWQVDGVKALVPRAEAADLLLVGAQRTDGEPGLFLVAPAEHEGVSVRPAPAMGLRSAATGDVRLDSVVIGEDALVGDAEAYADVVRRARLAWCALAVGTARAVLDYVIAYVNERKAFGEPISHRQSVAFNVADLAIELEGMRLLTLRAASRADAGKPFAQEVALARSLCVEQARRIGSDGVQLLGGHGFVKEHPVERWYRDLQAIGTLEGGVLV